MPTFDSTIKSAVVNFSSSGDNVIVASVAGQLIQMVGILIVVGGATNITFKSGTGTPLSGALPLTANGALILDPVPNLVWYQTLTAANNLVINNSNAVQVSGTVYYKQA
jgi:hypothetical protein